MAQVCQGCAAIEGRNLDDALNLLEILVFSKGGSTSSSVNQSMVVEGAVIPGFADIGPSSVNGVMISHMLCWKGL